MIIPLWIKAAVIAAVVGAAAWGVNAWGNKHEKIGYDRAVAEYAVKLAEAKDIALEKERFWVKTLQESENAATKRDQAKTARIAAVSRANDGLRNTVDNLRGQLATATVEACRKTADALATVFEECRGRYAEMGRAAEGHASDAMTCQEAWPRSK